jgi:hypothetical protein
MMVGPTRSSGYSPIPKVWANAIASGITEIEGLAVLASRAKAHRTSVLVAVSLDVGGVGLGDGRRHQRLGRHTLASCFGRSIETAGKPPVC